VGKSMPYAARYGYTGTSDARSFTGLSDLGRSWPPDGRAGRRPAKPAC
jgi:hypothetical protein